MSHESKSVFKPLPVLETTKTIEQLHLEADSIVKKEQELTKKHREELDALSAEKEKVFAQIRYLNSKLRENK